MLAMDKAAWRRLLSVWTAEALKWSGVKPAAAGLFSGLGFPGAVEAEHVLYVYIATPTTTQVRSFLRALADHGISISHLGKSDPPRKFEAAELMR